ncbi:MAG TPA: prephenate dehydratase [Solirubrobacteraceae bacterium]|jgi:prephenate dehydratase|nr:prephenate dehydratase [Solirubrobacteraceae bacterium]
MSSRAEPARAGADEARAGDPRGPAARTAVRVAYLGPAGTFTEQALLASAASGELVQPLPRAGIYEAVQALRDGEAAFAVVPIENSLEGSINVTLDLLADDAGDLEIVGEAVVHVHHALICTGQTALAEIETVLTHPQVPGQCTRLLRGELAHARVLAASSTAEAVRTVIAAGDPRRAAIGTALAAEIYGGTIVRPRVEDREDNQTRFVWLSLAGAAGPGAPPPLRVAECQPKTSLVFWGAGAERPGWLVRCLDEFARRDINLTKIESRPRRERLGNYMFFVDLAGHGDDPAVQAAIAGIAASCEQVRVLGSYRAAAPDPAAR